MCHPSTARLRGSELLAPRHRCSMAASVYSRVARKGNFQLFHFVHPLKMVHFKRFIRNSGQNFKAPGQQYHHYEDPTFKQISQILFFCQLVTLRFVPASNGD